MCAGAHVSVLKYLVAAQGLKRKHHCRHAERERERGESADRRGEVFPAGSGCLLLALSKHFNLKGAKFEMILKGLSFMPVGHYFLSSLLSTLGGE